MEVQEEVSFEGEKVKMTKVEKFFQSQREKFNKHTAGFENNIAEKVNKFFGQHENKLNDFIKHANTNIQTMDKKFSQMYGVLVRQFLTNLENRIYTNELGHKAFVQIISERLYVIQAKQDPENVLPKEDFLKELELAYVQKMTEVHNESEKAANEAQQVEEANVQTVQETVEPIVQTEEQVPKAE